MNAKLIALVYMSLVGAAAQAGTIFSDNFDANTLGLNKAPTGWTVSDGTVDIIGSGFFDFYPGNGAYVDLDGSTHQAGVLSRQLNLDGGVDYRATLMIGGSTRGDSNDVRVSFGSASGLMSYASNAALSPFNMAFTPAISGVYTLSIANAGGDNRGAILTSINVSAVPEPSSYALVLSGVAVLAAVARRRRPTR